MVTVLEVVRVVNAPVVGVVAPTVPFSGPAKPVAVTKPPKYEAPAAMYSEYGLVIVMFVPALGAPAMYRVDALV